jgi:DNA-binding CsgD family transcriptional regulator
MSFYAVRNPFPKPELAGSIRSRPGRVSRPLLVAIVSETEQEAGEACAHFRSLGYQVGVELLDARGYVTGLGEVASAYVVVACAGSLQQRAGQLDLRLDQLPRLVRWAATETGAPSRRRAPVEKPRRAARAPSVDREPRWDLPPSELTPRELEVLGLIAAGMATASIADYLTVSYRTVESHRRSARRKIGFRNAADVTRYALRHGLLPQSGSESKAA